MISGAGRHALGSPPTIAALVRKRNELRFERLAHALTERNQKHTGGFLLAVAAELAGDPQLSQWAEELRDRRRTKTQDFFAGPSTKRLRALAEQRTPELARSWNFRLNMTLDDFRSVMDKFGSDDPVPN